MDYSLIFAIVKTILYFSQYASTALGQENAYCRQTKQTFFNIRHTKKIIKILFFS